MDEAALYIGAKLIWARPMTNDSFSCIHGRQVGPETKVDGYEVTHGCGHVEWAALAEFKRTFRLVSERELALGRRA